MPSPRCRKIVVPAVLLAAVVAAGCGSDASAPAARPVPDFSLVERSGRTISLADLRGRVWIANFIFTRCTGPCPRTTASMARLASEIRSPDVRFVSVTVDPAHDTKEVLSAYAASYGADSERWLFLTGTEEDIVALCRDGFRLGVAAAPPGEAAPGAEVAHSTRFAVVDRDGTIRGYFDDEDEESMLRLRETVAGLL